MITSVAVSLSIGDWPERPVMHDRVSWYPVPHRLPGSGYPGEVVTRVLLVDDSPAVRAGLSLLLGGVDGIQVVGSCVDGSEVVAAAAALQPDIVLMDVSMPGTDGIAATAALVAAEPAARVLMLTTSVTGDVVHRALAAGAIGYLIKGADPAELVAAVRDVASGGTAWSAPALEALRHGPGRHGVGSVGHPSD
jgi:DNA-binding NarL/FixJ family response regulator